MTVSISTFRTDMPEFSDSTAYPDSWITRYLNIANVQLSSGRWDASIIDYATELFIAHHLVLQQRRSKAATNGGAPGGNTGMLNSKSVDSVSAGYDTSSTALENGGQWNLTDYGIQFLQLARMYGAGGVQIQ